MMQTITKTQRILEINFDDFLTTWIDGFLLDRKASGLAKRQPGILRGEAADVRAVL